MWNTSLNMYVSGSSPQEKFGLYMVLYYSILCNFPQLGTTQLMTCSCLSHHRHNRGYLSPTQEPGFPPSHTQSIEQPSSPDHYPSLEYWTPGQSYRPPWLSTTNAIIGVWWVLPKMKPVLSQRVWRRPHAATCSHTLPHKLRHMVPRRQHHDVTSLPGTTDVTSRHTDVKSWSTDGQLTKLLWQTVIRTVPP
jgi:hypothetical protein